jgi:hypothetical protein
MQQPAVWPVGRQPQHAREPSTGLESLHLWGPEERPVYFAFKYALDSFESSLGEMASRLNFPTEV